MHHIHHDIYIKAASSKVYEAISQPEHLINWWPLKCTGEPTVGCDYNFFFGEEYDWYGKVQEVKNNESFHINMTSADSDWTPTRFGFDIRTEDDGVWLEFWHKDWPELNHHYKRSSCCWAILLQGLKYYVEKGDVIPFRDRA